MENIPAEKSQLWKFVTSQQQSIIDPILQMKSTLQHKYVLSFNFFLSKPINEIVYELTSRPVTQAFIDSRIAAQDAEYLKRCYHFKTEQGVEELNDRIKMLGQFYNMSQKSWKYQYPMMIVTDTKSIFEKRQRRYKKICAGQGSSDETQQKSQFYCYSFDTQHFLKDMSNISRMYNEQKNDENEQSFDSDVHDVYLKDASIYTKLTFTPDSLHQIQSPLNILKKETVIDHLICDFEQISVQVQQKQKPNISKDRQSFKSLTNNNQSGRRPLKSYDIKNLSHPKINDENIKQGDNKIKKPNFLSSYLNLFENKYRKIYLQNNHSTLGNTDIKTTTDENDTVSNNEMKRIDLMIQNQKQQKMKHRKKIRQKAQQLLRRVRISSQID